MRNLWLITKEDFKNLIENPMWIFYTFLLPIVMTAIVGYLSERSYGDRISSYDYYGITMMVYSLISSGMTSANAFLEERIKKPNMRIIYAPSSPRNIYLSKIIASFGFSVLFHGLDLIFLILVFHVHTANLLFLVMLFVLTDLFSNTLGILLCCLVKSEIMTNQIQSIVINLLAILGGVIFSLDGYGKLLAFLSKLSPVKWILDAAFQMIYDKDLHLFGPTAMFLILGTLVMIIICNRSFHKEDCIC